MSLNARLGMFGPFFTIILMLAICVSILMILFPKAILRRRSMVIPQKMIRTVRIIGIIALCLILLGSFAVNLLVLIL